MRNIFLIARREYLERIRTKAFMVTTILIPALMGGSLMLPQLFINRLSKTEKHIVVVASDPHMGEIIGQQLNREKEEENEQREAAQKQFSGELPKREAPHTAQFKVDVDANTSAEERTALAEKVKQKQLDGVIWATREALEARQVTFITRDTSSIIDNEEIRRSIGAAMQRELLLSKGLTGEDIKNAQKGVTLQAESPTGAKGGDTLTNLLAMVFLVLILFMSILIYGVQVMQSVLEEKSSRVMEVMLATAQPKEMMAGKILGVGAVGLTQVAIWGLAGLILSFSGILASGGQLKDVVSLKILFFFPVFYLLGYLLQSSLYAAVGAMCNSQQEAQQVQQLVMLPMMLPAFMITYVIQYPDSPLSVGASMFPLTSPLIMFARIALRPVPWWEIAISLGILLATIYVVILLSAKIYRVGILMYGKRPTLPEIMKWIRYA